MPQPIASTPTMKLSGVVQSLRLAHFKLAAFDMDSTLINIECIDEIADAAGRKAEVAAITEAAMRGEITDFKDSLRRRVAMLEGVHVEHLQRVYDERLKLNPGVEAFTKALREAGVKLALVSGGFTFFSDRVKARLQMDYAKSNLLEVANDRLTGRVLPHAWGDICDGAEKRRTVLELCAQLGCTPAQAMAVGDGSNDLPMMNACKDVGGLSIAFHAKPAVAAQAMVSVPAGGLDQVLSLFEPT